MDVEEVVLMNIILNDLGEAEYEARRPQGNILQRGNPLENLSEEEFVKKFRLSKALTRHVINMVTPLIPNPYRRSALTVETKVLVALRFYGYGSYQEVTGSNIFTGVSQSSVSRSIRDVTNALNECMNEYIAFPRNIQELTNARTRFYQKLHFPGAIGCIDCTHVAIVAPRGDANHPEHVYVNRKGYHSINVQLVCDENLKLLNVNSRFPGSVHDAHIWRQSGLSSVMERIYRQNPNNLFFLLGDSGYPLRPWLLTPLRNAPQPGTPEERMDRAQKFARNVVERCNGVLKNRFRCLLKDRVLHYHPVMASKIINACAVLHNLCIIHNLPDQEEAINIMNDGLIVEEIGHENVHNQDLERAREIQQHIINSHFQ